MSLSASQLLTFVFSRADGAARAWLQDAVTRAAAGQREALYSSYTAAPRRSGRQPLGLSGLERQELAAAAPSVVFDRWTREDAARAALLLAFAERAAADDFAATAIECYERGDSREQQSWLTALPLLPHAERFLAVAIDACRTNIVPQFEAIACDNPYPARYFPQPNFNQLVLKSMFVGLALDRIVGLGDRLNPELSRMALDYAAERRAAGRSVPADLALALTGDARTEEQLR